MSGFPATPDFTGLNAPVGVETRIERLEVEGKIPPEIEGAFFRAVPDPAFAPLFDDDTALSGDGMISKLHFHDGQVDFAIRFVETARYKAEKAAGRTLFGRYRNLHTDLPEAAGIDRTVANTTPVWHAGRLFMTKEDGRGYEMNPHSLETIGSWDFHGALRSETMTAHVRIDPGTKEMFFYGYEAGGLCTTDVAYCIADIDGNLVSEQWFQTPYCAMMHDFAITERYAVFPVFPTTSDPERVKAGGVHWIHEPELESWVGVMPRHGKVEAMRWFKGPKGVSAYHFLNAFEDEAGMVHLDVHLSDTNAFPFIRAASGIERQPWEIKGGLTRWSMDMTGEGTELSERVIGPGGDMPRIADADQGRRHARGWYLSVDPTAGPPVMGGPVGAMFNLVLRIEPETGALTSYTLPPGHSISEPVHIPSRAPAHEGWLMAIVDTQRGPDDFSHAAWVFDAGNVPAGPVAKVKIPARLRPQVHGWWVPAVELAMSKRH